MLAAVPLVAACFALGCGPQHSTGSAASSPVAASSAAAAASAQAAKLVAPCLTTADVSVEKTCIEAAVPAAKQAALMTCLDNVVAVVPGVHATADEKAFADGARSCVAKALSS